MQKGVSQTGRSKLAASSAHSSGEPYSIIAPLQGSSTVEGQPRCSRTKLRGAECGGGRVSGGDCRERKLDAVLGWGCVGAAWCVEDMSSRAWREIVLPPLVLYSLDRHYTVDE